VLEPDHRNTSDNQELADRLRKSGDALITEVHIHTDHPFSHHRIATHASDFLYGQSATTSLCIPKDSFWLARCRMSGIITTIRSENPRESIVDTITR
jgi:hypothetical protein